MGAGLGLAMLYWHPLIAIGALVPLYGLHVASLRHVIKAENAFDAETGLWSEDAWREQARQKLSDARGHVALFVIAPVRAGQEREILRTIGPGLRPSDLLGRYRPRQIVALIPVGRPEAGPFLGAGFRAGLTAGGVRAALGCATSADSDLESLVTGAMSDL